jgi:hypothetical protein
MMLLSPGYSHMGSPAIHKSKEVDAEFAGCKRATRSRRQTPRRLAAMFDHRDAPQTSRSHQVEPARACFGSELFSSFSPFVSTLSVGHRNEGL